MDAKSAERRSIIENRGPAGVPIFLSILSLSATLVTKKSQTTHLGPDTYGPIAGNRKA